MYESLNIGFSQVNDVVGLFSKWARDFISMLIWCDNHIDPAWSSGCIWVL